MKSSNSSAYNTVWNWKLLKFTRTIFSQKFREINSLLKNFILNWIDEKNIYLNAFDFLVFPHYCVYTAVWSLRNFCIIWELFREINFIVKLFTKKLFSRKLFKKSWYKKFLNSTQWCVQRFHDLFNNLVKSNCCKLISRHFPHFQIDVNFRLSFRVVQ